MILELRRSAFDTDLILSDQSCQDISPRISSGNINEIINPRRVEALQRDYERLGFQVRRIENQFLKISFLLGSSRTNKRFSDHSSGNFIITKFILFLYSSKK
jgi:hypothetical protein